MNNLSIDINTAVVDKKINNLSIDTDRVNIDREADHLDIRTNEIIGSNSINLSAFLSIIY